jgi:non-homologous end joining protein Ku
VKEAGGAASAADTNSTVTPVPENVVSLMDALRRSLAEANLPPSQRSEAALPIERP